MKKTILLVISTALLVMIGCEENNMPTGSENSEVLSEENSTLEKSSNGISTQALEKRLQHFAKALAKAVVVPEVASFLKEEIGKKFDGDYEALWMNMKNKTISGKGNLRGILASNLKGLNGVIHSMAGVEQVPKLQIAIPIGFTEWDGKTPIKVAYTPLTTNDTEVENIYAFDAGGNEYTLDTQIPPGFPVIVVGINERTDEEGNLTFHTQSISSDIGKINGRIDNLDQNTLDPNYGIMAALELPGDGGGGGGGGGGYYPFITEFKATRHPNQYEPWYMGKAEVYWIAYVTNTETGVTDLGMMEGDWSYTCWKLTWTGWHSNLNWKTLDHKINPYDPSSPNSLSSITFYELDWPAHDGIKNDPWFTWNCADFADWPLIGWSIQIICDLTQNTGNFWANDDYIGSVKVNLTTSTQQFDGDGVKVKMKKSFYY